MPKCLRCGTELPVNDEGMAPVLCDNCAGRATRRARVGLKTGTMRDRPATTALLAINLAVYTAMVLTGAGFWEMNGSALLKWGANFGPMTLSGEYWRLVTAGFLHGGLLHIAFNMWCLWSLGELSERLFGKWQTFAIYLVTGVGGSLLSIASDSNRFEVGASGAIFGIAGALLAGVKFGNLTISSGEKRAITSSMIFFVGINFMLGQSSFMGGRVDNMCHLGGFVTGLLIGLPLGAFAQHHKLYQLATVVITSLVLAAGLNELVKNHGSDALLFRAEIAAQQGDMAKAITSLEQYTSNHKEDDKAFIFLGALYSETNQRDKAVAAFQNALKANPQSRDAKEALSELGADQPGQK
jgi:rhomboid protease GluP